jgi:glycosyltransferase involved in cell wall biosynthesis
MACGTPVITSNTSSLPEIVGDAGILVNPEDAGEIAEAIGNVLDNDSKRDEMRTKGIERAKRFSWEKCARETLKLYREVASP